jgi:hypothetical protein
MRSCPFCAEEIQDAAIVCKHCGRDVPPAEVPSETGSLASASRDEGFSFVAQAAPTVQLRNNQALGAVLGFIGAGLFVVGSLLPNYGSSDPGISLIGFGDYVGKVSVGLALSYWSIAAAVIVGAALSFAPSKLGRLGAGMVLAGGVCLLCNSLAVALFFTDDRGFGVWIELLGSVLSTLAGVLLFAASLASDER